MGDDSGCVIYKEGNDADSANSSNKHEQCVTCGVQLSTCVCTSDSQKDQALVRKESGCCDVERDVPQAADPEAHRKRKFTCHQAVAIVVAFFINLSVMVPSASLSVLYIEYVTHFEVSVTTIGFLPSAYFIGRSAAGLIVGNLAQKYGARRVAVCGVLTITMATFLITYARSVHLLVALYAVVGFGGGTVSLCNASTLQQNFTKNRTVATAMSSAGFSVGNFFYAPMTRLVCDVFGWRTWPVIMASITLQGAWLAMFLVPNGNKTKSSSSNPDRGTKTRVKETVADTNRGACPSCECQTLNNLPFFLFLVVASVHNMSSSSLTTHIVNKAIFMGTTKRTAAMIPSILGFAAIISRVCIGILTWKFTINKLVLYSIGMFGFGTCVLLMNVFHSFAGLAACAASSVFFIIIINVVSHALMVDLVGIENVFRAMGVFMFAVGLGLISGSPFTAFMYDISEDYRVPFYVTGTLSCLGTFLALAIIPISRARSQRAQEGRVGEEVGVEHMNGRTEDDTNKDEQLMKMKKLEQEADRFMSSMEQISSSQTLY